MYTKYQFEGKLCNKCKKGVFYCTKTKTKDVCGELVEVIEEYTCNHCGNTFEETIYKKIN